MDFSSALLAVKYGRRIHRAGWDGNDMWVCLSPGFELPASAVFSRPIAKQIGDGVGSFRPYLMMYTAQGDFVPWFASQTDLLAEDWFEYQIPDND